MDFELIKLGLDQLLLYAYHFKAEKGIKKIANKIRETQKTAQVVQEVWKSNRAPYTIMLSAAKVGMYIPPIHRVGIQAFNFFIENIRYYEKTFSRCRSFPSKEEIFLSENKIDLLSQFRDDEILSIGVKWTPDYSDRKKMIQSFIDDNIIQERGIFSLDSNARSSYHPNARIILYTQKDTRIALNIEELGKAIDPVRRVVWKANNESFDPLSLLQLRSLILKKFSQWKDRTGHPDGPNELLNLVYRLDSDVF